MSVMRFVRVRGFVLRCRIFACFFSEKVVWDGAYRGARGRLKLRPNGVHLRLDYLLTMIWLYTY